MIPLENKPLQTLYQIQLVLPKKISLPHDSPRLITLQIHERLCTALSSNALCFTEKLMPLLTVLSILLISRQKLCRVHYYSYWDLLLLPMAAIFKVTEGFLLSTGIISPLHRVQPMIPALCYPHTEVFYSQVFFP